MAKAEVDEQPPQEIIAGKYRLSKLLGRGGMGAVWEGVHQTLGTRVAVKFIDKQHASSEDIRQRFVNEAKAAARLRSKHVVQVYDQGVTDDGRPYIVMEFLGGEALDARLDRVGRLPAPDTARILVQVARALAKAHDAKIIHRDLKPENVFLVWDEEDQMDIVKVVDFGIAKFADATEGHTAGSTRTGAVLGTPHYMSPEQARGLRSIDVRSDIWSLGVIAYRCIVGKLPFEGEAVGDLLVKICTTKPAPPSSLVPNAPAEFDRVVEKALAQEPADRYGTVMEFADALCRACGVDVRAPAHSMALGSSRGAPPRSIPAPRRARQDNVTEVPLTNTVPRSGKRTQLVVGLAAFAAVGLGVVGFMAARAARETSITPAVAAEPLPGASVRAAAEPPPKVEPEAQKTQPAPTAEASEPEEKKPEPENEATIASAAPPKPAVARSVVKAPVRPVRPVSARPARPKPQEPKRQKPPADLLGY